MPTEATPPAAIDSHLSEPDCWQVVPGGSSLTFTVRHIVIHEIRGCFHRWGGHMFVDPRRPAASSVEIWVDLGSLDTGSPERDAQVRSQELLDVRHFPFAEFKSDSIEGSGDQFKVHGHLKLHGVRRPVDLDVKPLMVVQDANTAQATYEATTTIDRQSFGLHWNQDLDVGGIVVGDRIRLNARVEAIRSLG